MVTHGTILHPTLKEPRLFVNAISRKISVSMKTIKMKIIWFYTPVHQLTNL